ncbi:MAG: ATP-binding cassette domain-containing protein [Chromatiales bacterium]|nr:ATP-binding cassette domain-containing protein [Chromatiales bacterium]
MNDEGTAHIEVRDLALAYGDRVVQEGLNFSIARGEVFIIMGGSGCGKSSLMKAMTGLLRPSAGDVWYEGQPYWAGDEQQRQEIRQRCGVLFQSGALWSSLTLAENVALPMRHRTRLSEAQIEELCAWRLALVGLRGFEDYYPNELSGGMRKRAGLARAMALDPEILYFDEPSAGLDPVSARLLDDLILELSASLGTTIVVVTHDLASIFAIAGRALYLDAGSRTQLALGEPAALREHCEHAAVRAFLSREATVPADAGETG